MSKQSIILSIEGGQIVNKSAVKALFGALLDGRYIIEISTGNRRSNPQNRYYHGLIVPMIRSGLKDMGNDFSKEEVHEFLKSKFNYTEVVNHGTGQYERIPRSTSRLTTVEFMDFIAKIQQFAAEFLNLVIPDPGQQVQMEF